MTDRSGTAEVLEDRNESLSNQDGMETSNRLTFRALTLGYLTGKLPWDKYRAFELALEDADLSGEVINLAALGIEDPERAATIVRRPSQGLTVLSERSRRPLGKRRRRQLTVRPSRITRNYR